MAFLAMCVWLRFPGRFPVGCSRSGRVLLVPVRLGLCLCTTGHALLVYVVCALPKDAEPLQACARAGLKRWSLPSSTDSL